MTYTVGIDIAKYEHVASIINSNTGEMIVDSLHFDNNHKGFKLLLSNLSKLNKNDIRIGFESTAHYHQSLFNYLTRKGYKCILINPYMTSRFRSISLRNAKNDNIDSRAIATFLSFNYSDLLEDEFIINDLKELSNQRKSLIELSTASKIKLVSYLDRTFPELESIVDKHGLHSKAIRAILKAYPSAYRISRTRIDKLINLSSEASGNKYPKNKIILIKQVSKDSIGIDIDGIALRIKQTIELLESIERQIDEINIAITNHPLVIESPLHKLKGINSIEIGYIMSAIISIKRFTSSDKLVAYAGLDPIVRQSGTWSASRTRMSKRGNKLLRYVLIWTANNMRKYPSKMKDYYDKKISEGKSHYNALGHCAAKLCRYIFYILNNPNKEFIN